MEETEYAVLQLHVERESFRLTKELLGIFSRGCRHDMLFNEQSPDDLKVCLHLVFHLILCHSPQGVCPYLTNANEFLSAEFIIQHTTVAKLATGQGSLGHAFMKLCSHQTHRFLLFLMCSQCVCSFESILCLFFPNLHLVIIQLYWSYTLC